MKRRNDVVRPNRWNARWNKDMAGQLAALSLLLGVAALLAPPAAAQSLIIPPGGHKSFFVKPHPDFNRDGFTDLAVVVEGESAVHIIWGSQYGLTKTGNTVMMQGLGVSSLAVGDFDGDGFTDLAMGLPGAIVNGVTQAGMVQVHFGSAGGLSATKVPQQVSGASAGMPGTVGQNERFGASLAAADFNGDGSSDLAITAGGDGAINYGKVHVLSGGASGLRTTGSLLINEGYAATAVAAGDFNGDGYADLAIGLPNAWVGPTPGGGQVNVIYGSAYGVNPNTYSQFFTLNSVGAVAVAQNNSWFGSAMSAHDFNHDGKDDLVIGAYGENGFNGEVVVLFGSGTGVTSVGSASLMVGFQGLQGNSTGAIGFGSAIL